MRRFGTTPCLVSIDRSPRLRCRSKLKTRKFGTISQPQSTVFRLAYRAGRKLIKVAYLAIETLSLPWGHLLVNKKFKHNTAACSINYFSSGKSVSWKQWQPVSVALDIQHAKRIDRILLSSVACPALIYFSTLSHKRYGIQKKKDPEHKMCILISCTTLAWYISRPKKNQVNKIIKAHVSSCKVLVIIVRF
jgi:hypothetical protein